MSGDIRVEKGKMKWDPKTLEIRTHSVEKTLEPLVHQVRFRCWTRLSCHSVLSVEKKTRIIRSTMSFKVSKGVVLCSSCCRLREESFRESPGHLWVER